MKPGGADGRSASGGICGARTRAGGICQKPGMANGRCANHGGKSLRGLEAYQFRHGRYSKALKQLDEDISDRVNDPALVDPRRSLAVQEGVMARLGELVGEGDAPEFRETVRRRFREAMEVMKDDPAEALTLLRALGGYLERGVEESRALVAMQESAEKLNKSQTRYWQTAMNAARAISPEEFIQLMFRMADIIEAEVDADAARRILRRTDAEVCGGALGLSDG